MLEKVSGNILLCLLRIMKVHRYLKMITTYFEIIIGMGLSILMLGAGFLIGKEYTEQRTFENSIKDSIKFYATITPEHREEQYAYLMDLLAQAKDLDMITEKNYKELCNDLETEAKKPYRETE